MLFFVSGAVAAVAGAEFLFAAPLGVVTEGCADSGVFCAGLCKGPCVELCSELGASDVGICVRVSGLVSAFNSGTGNGSAARLSPEIFLPTEMKNHPMSWRKLNASAPRITDRAMAMMLPAAVRLSRGDSSGPTILARSHASSKESSSGGTSSRGSLGAETGGISVVGIDSGGTEAIGASGIDGDGMAGATGSGEAGGGTFREAEEVADVFTAWENAGSDLVALNLGVSGFSGRGPAGSGNKRLTVENSLWPAGGSVTTGATGSGGSVGATAFGSGAGFGGSGCAAGLCGDVGYPDRSSWRIFSMVSSGVDAAGTTSRCPTVREVPLASHS